MRPLFTLSVFVTLLVPPAQFVTRPARAAEPAERVEAWKIPYQRCQDLIREGDYPGALEACERASAMNPEPGILVHIARIQTALVHPVQAHEALERYRHSAGLDEANRKTAEAQLRYLDTLIATLSITTRIDGAEIRVDDRRVEPSALAKGIPVTAGAHRITLLAKDTSFSRFVVLRGAERAQLDLPGTGLLVPSCPVPRVRLFIDGQPADPAQAASGVPREAGQHRVRFEAAGSAWPEQSVLVNPDERATVTCALPPPEPQKVVRETSNPRGYWLMGAGLALAGASVATAVYNGSQYDRWQTANDDLRRERPDLTLAEQVRRSRENDQLMDSIQTKRTVAVGLGIAGGLVTAGGVVLLFTDAAPTERRRSQSWFYKFASSVTFSGDDCSGKIGWRGAW